MKSPRLPHRHAQRRLLPGPGAERRRPAGDSWVIRERLTRQAQEAVDGRTNFEKHVGRKSDKPLTITIDPRDLLAVLNEETPV